MVRDTLEVRDIQQVKEVMEGRMQDPKLDMQQVEEEDLAEDRKNRAIMMEEVMEEDLRVPREDGVMEEGRRKI